MSQLTDAKSGFMLMLLLLYHQSIKAEEVRYKVGTSVRQHEGWNTFKNLSLIPTHLRQHGLFAPNISPSGSFIYADSHHGYMQFNNGNNHVTNLLTLQRLLSQNGINSDGQRHYQYVLPSVYHTCKDLLVMSFHLMTFHNYEVDRTGLHSCILLFNTTSHEIQRRISCSSEHFENEDIEDLALEEENQRFLYIHTTSKLLVIDTHTGQNTVLHGSFAYIHAARYVYKTNKISLFRKQIFILRIYIPFDGGSLTTYSLERATLSSNFSALENPFEIIANSTRRGMRAGSFRASIWTASDLYAISENTIVLTDEQHFRLWVAEINSQRIWSMCNGHPDDIEGDWRTCSLRGAVKLEKQANYLYIILDYGIFEMELRNLKDFDSNEAGQEEISTTEESPSVSNPSVSQIPIISGSLVAAGIFAIAMIGCLIRKQPRCFINQGSAEAQVPSRPLPEINVPEPVREGEFYYQLGDQYYECVYDEGNEYYEIDDHQTLSGTDSFQINADNEPTEENSRHNTQADNPCKTQRNTDDANDSAIENESVISVVTSSMHHGYCDQSLCVEEDCEQYSLSTEVLNAIDPEYLQPSICSKKKKHEMLTKDGQ